MLGPDDARPYAWADDLAWTVSVVTGKDRADVIRAYGGDPNQEAALMTFDDAHVGEDDVGAVSLVQVRQVGAHVIMIENIGWLGMTERIAERVSSDGAHFLRIYSSSGNMDLTEARDSKVVAKFNPVFAVEPEDRDIDRGEILPERFASVKFSFDTLGATMLAIVEQQTGLAFDRAWLDEPTPTYRIAYPGVGGTRMPTPTT